LFFCFIAFVQNAADGITGEFFCVPCDRVASSRLHGSSSFWSTPLQSLESSAQAERIELIDGENAKATLSAARPADQPIPTLFRCVGQGRVEDLDQSAITTDGEMRGHIDRIMGRGQLRQ
jgi:hypothetical protein